jgi:hypothetical protein
MSACVLRQECHEDYYHSEINPKPVIQLSNRTWTENVESLPARIETCQDYIDIIVSAKRMADHIAERLAPEALLSQ